MKLIVQLIFLIAALLISLSSYAFQLSVEPVGTLPPDIAQQLVTVTPVKKVEDTYLVATKAGDIYRVTLATTEKAPEKIFSLQHAQNGKANLTAFALHPSFSLRDQPGHGIFYTAHTEAAQPDKKFLIVRDEYVDRDMISDHAVVTEWQVDSSGNVDIGTKREIIRIALPDSAAAIRELAFNPAKKVWNDDYGLLLIGLDAVSQWQKSPLYSGAILRINPARFGLKNFTVPATNPFIKDKSLPAEVFAYGLSAINQISWLANGNGELAIDHSIGKQRKFSRVEAGSNGINKAETLYQLPGINGNNNQMLIYQGKQLAGFWSYLVFSHPEQGKWQVSAVSSRGGKQLANVLWPFDSRQPLYLFNDHFGELLVISPKNGSITKVINLNIPGGNEQALTPSADLNSNHSAKYVVIIILVIFITFFGYHVFNKFFAHKHPTRHFLQKQFVKVTYEPSLRELLLFEYHNDVVAKKIGLDELTSINLMLNDTALLTISEQQGLSQVLEQAARKLFIAAKQEKLEDGEKREITLKLQHANDDSTEIYFYLRKGKNRLTRANYQQCINDVINLCWQLSEAKAPLATEKRQLIETANRTRVNTANKAQASQSNANPTNSGSSQHSADICSSSAAKPTLEENTNPVTQPTTNEKALESHAKTDAELITALEKLVKLKEQHYLTEQEFEQAKAKLLKQLL